MKTEDEDEEELLFRVLSGFALRFPSGFPAGFDPGFPRGFAAGFRSGFVFGFLASAFEPLVGLVALAQRRDALELLELLDDLNERQAAARRRVRLVELEGARIEIEPPRRERERRAARRREIERENQTAAIAEIRHHLAEHHELRDGVVELELERRERADRREPPTAVCVIVFDDDRVSDELFAVLDPLLGESVYLSREPLDRLGRSDRDVVSVPIFGFIHRLRLSCSSDGRPSRRSYEPSLDW